MEGRAKRTVVNSWNEWDPLKHVIVGVADGGMFSSLVEPSLKARFFLDTPKNRVFKEKAGTPRSAVDQEKANAQLDNFADILRKEGIRVDRPKPLDFTHQIVTPDFKNEGMYGCMPPRDVLLTVGKEILEAAMSYRCRWFEYLCYRDLLNSYFEDDPEMRMEAAPKPRLSDNSYKLDYVERAKTEEERLQLIKEKDFVTTEAEVLFDAADVIRCGKDLFVQHGMTTNLKGINWLKRHFSNHRINTINFPGDQFPIHVDATLVPLRPGLVISNPDKPLPEEQRKIFEINHWEIIPAAAAAHKESPPLSPASVWLSMNILILDPKTVCVEASEVHQIKQLEKLGFEVIPVPFRDAFPFGGALHCATADVYREGVCEDYFPKQVEKL